MLALLVGTALAAGFRIDGSGQVPGAASQPPATGEPRWKLPLDAPGNASVVAFGDDVCVTQDPATVLCVDARTGVEHWRASHPVLAVVPSDPALRERVEAAEAAAEGLDARREALGPLTKRARSGDAAAKAELASARAALAADEAAVEAMRPWLTLPADVHNGWTAPTPVTDGVHLWVQLGNGVVACHGRDGALVWAQWLGPDSTPLAFFDGVPTASPTLVGDMLVVAYGTLRGLDAATGGPRWIGPSWSDYGSPTAMEVGGLAVVLTPAGEVVRASDGVVLASGLSQHPWFNAPVVDGDLVWWVGGQATPARGFRASARALRLVREGDRVVATPHIDVALASRDRFYAGPVVFGDRVVAVDNVGHLVAIDRHSGAVGVELELAGLGQVWASPLVVGDQLWVQGLDGTFVVLDGDLKEVTRFGVGDRTLAGPWVAEGGVWVRSHGALWAL